MQENFSKIIQNKHHKETKTANLNIPLKTQQIHTSPSGLACRTPSGSAGERGREIYPNSKTSTKGKSRHPKIENHTQHNKNGALRPNGYVKELQLETKTNKMTFCKKPGHTASECWHKPRYIKEIRKENGKLKRHITY